MTLWIALLPVILSLVLIIVTKRTIVSLLSGFLLGTILLYKDDLINIPEYALTTLWNALKSPWHYSALIFTLLLGGFASLLQAGGGLTRLFGNVKTPRQLQTRTIGLGLVCFFDGLASGVLVARVVRPVADRLNVSREKVAYLADTTSSAVACLAPVSTWIAMQLGLISTVLATRGISTSPYQVFLQSIPFNFYCIFALILAFTIALTGIDFGPMAKTSATKEKNPAEASNQAKLFVPLLSIATLLVSIPLLYYLLSTPAVLPFSLSKLSEAMGSNKGPTVFILTGIIGLIVPFLLTRHLSFAKKSSAVAKGIGQMLAPLLVLICAWLFGSVIKDLGLASALSSLLGGGFTLSFFPALVFLLGALLSFTTGSSWGTMAILFPLTFGAAEGIGDAELLTYMPLLIAAIFSGSVFGDHSSPYSDTTIVSAVAAGCTPYDHVRTQLPYALTCGGSAALFFLIVGLYIGR